MQWQNELELKPFEAIMNIYKQAAKILIDRANQIKIALGEKPLPKSHLSKSARSVKSRLDNEELYHSYEVICNKLQFMAFTFKNENVWMGKYIQVLFVCEDDCPTLHKKLAREIENIKNFYGESYKLIFETTRLEKKMISALKRVGYSPKAFTTTGDVSKALKKLSKVEIPKGYEIVPTVYRRDMGSILEGEELSHVKEPTSLLTGGYSRPMVKEFKSMYKELIGQKGAFVIRKNGKVVGGINLMDLGDDKYKYIASIWVHPRHQGKGLGKGLYRFAMDKMHSSGVTTFIGYSGTEKVLEYGKKLGRVTVVNCYILE